MFQKSVDNFWRFITSLISVWVQFPHKSLPRWKRGKVKLLMICRFDVGKKCVWNVTVIQQVLLMSTFSILFCFQTSCFYRGWDFLIDNKFIMLHSSLHDWATFWNIFLIWSVNIYQCWTEKVHIVKNLY